MKYFKFWIKEKFQISIRGNNEDIVILSGSNQSKSDALEKAKINLNKIEKRINSGDKKASYDNYIKEFVAEEINNSNIITVCRYGAKILNTNQYTILDLDDYPVNFMDIFKSLSKLSKKERIIYKFEEKIKRNPFFGDDLRIYETAKGIRVICKKYISPSQNSYRSMMRKFFVDWIYVELSIKQNCYRARLTPKPYRMKFKTIKIKSPIDCETEHYKNWEKSYTENSKKYSVVKLVKAFGKDFSNDPIIILHDKYCNSSHNYKLV